MTHSNASSDNLQMLFQAGRLEEVVNIASKQHIDPARDPNGSQVVAAALFKLGKFAECLEWCRALSPALHDLPDFSSLYGAALRRNDQLSEAETIFRKAIEKNPHHAALRNNFANVLIDCRKLNEAETLLLDLLRENPDYKDAQENLNRLRFQQSLGESVRASSPKINVVPYSNINSLQDPLLAAFAEEEISRPASSKNTSTKNELNSALLNALPDRLSTKETEEFLTLTHKLAQSNPKQAITDCIAAHNKLGVQPAIYETAAQAYIRLKLFADAESCLLNAIVLGSQKSSNFLNLANIVAMRGDQKLALHYLEKVAIHSPNDQQLISVRNTLFPNGIPEISTSPFQLNLDQQAKGSFS